MKSSFFDDPSLFLLRVSRLRNHGDGKNSDFTDLNNEGILKTLEQIEEKASSFLNLSPQFNHMVESLKKKEERLRVVESREKEVALLEKSVSEKSRVLEEIEMDFDMIQVLEASLLRLVIERQTEVAVRKKLEDVTSECERKKVEAKLVFESIHEKLCGLEKAEKDFDVKQRVEMVRLSSLEEAIKVIYAELKRKEERFELKQKEEAYKWREETETKRKDLEIRENTLEERMTELQLKQMVLEERSKQSAETRKRSNHEVEHDNDAGSLTPPAKKHKSEEADSACASKDGDIGGGIVCKDPKPLTCPDTKFNGVCKSMSSFAVDQGEESEGMINSELKSETSPSEKNECPLPPKAPVNEVPPDNEFEKRIRPEVIPADEIGVTFADIGSLDETKESLQELVMLPLRRPDLFKGGLLKPCRGILLFGPPGTGKTMMAKAIAKEAGASFINVSMSTITSKWFGEDEKNVRALFTLAAKVSPTIIFVDEVDSMLGQRTRAGEHEAMRKIKNEFMTHWDGLMSSSGDRILVLAATNRPFDLDEAIIRRIMVGLPSVESREKILRTLLSKEKTENLDFHELAQMTDGYSGSDLKV
ncbi:hypothetical protein DY000_02027441 [Brassica cretica]|uniref:AAA+ ATPase domain-containing protein n=1 Tax=Brassica cretica TaxID=69181 RepID=A0ABQ7E0A4_BRACR|nr:hypothetical protein DY000_02027441 [Brassica cretica]